MEKTEWYLGGPNSVVLCVDRAGGGQPEGRFYHAYAQEGTSFANMEEAIFQLERLYDSLNFPHPTTNGRTFQKQGGHTEPGKERTRVMKDEELLSRHGDLGTFIIRVQHRQNSSWQGRITWMDRNKTLYFRSIWEMIKLVASALDTVSGQEDGAQEQSWQDEKDS